MKKNSLLLIKMMSKLLFYGLSLQMMFIGVLLAEDSKAQDMKNIRQVYVDIQVQDAKVEDVFQKLERETNFRFTYDIKDVSSIKINLNKSKRSLYNVLEEISRQGKLHFRQTNYDIDVKKITDDTDNRIPVEVIIQTRNITGTVTSYEEGEGLPGVNVVEKGTTNGTVTDVQGNYSLEVSEGATIVFSSVGYTQEEVVVGNQSVIDLAMMQDIQQLQELVVVGYGTQQKRDLTGAVASVNSKELSRLPVSSIDQALQGRASGVQVVQGSGAPGSNVTIRIRGTNSIQGGNDPLFIVDGFPVTGGIGNINPNEIENIEILKDASATAIYGARATNGVVIITTKKGSKGESRIDFDMYYGIQQVTRKLDLMNAQDFMSLANERAVNDGEPALFFPDPASFDVNTDWQEEIFRTAPIQNYNLRMSGGSQQFRYSISGNYFDQEGILKETNYNLASLRVNLDGDINPWLDVSNSLFIVRTNRNNRPDQAIAQALISAPTLPVYDMDGNFQTANIYPFSPGALENPVAQLSAENIRNQNIGSRIFNNFAANFKITKELSFRSSFGVDLNTERRERYSPRVLVGSPAGRAAKTFDEDYSYLNENIINFKKTVNDAHSFDIVAGYTWQLFERTDFTAANEVFVTDELENNDLGSGSNVQLPSSGGTRWGLASWLGRINYSLKDKYLFTLSGRADGSSRFSEENRWAFFPSAAFAWRISDEPFMANVGISNLKLRTSYGRTGNQAVNPFQTRSRVNAIDLAMGDQLQIGYFPANIANPNLKWETTDQLNVGIDFGVFQERLRFTADYYYKVTNDLLAQVDLPLSSGFPFSTQNIGSMVNQGFELNIAADIFDNEFKWTSGINFWLNRNRITELAGGVDVFAPNIENLIPSMHILREGEPISQFFGFVRDGLTDDGNTKYLDLNEDGEINDDDRKIIGTPHPNFQLGWNNDFTFKNFSLNVFIEASQGFDIIAASRVSVANSFIRGGNQLQEVFDNHWSPDNPNPNARYPIISSTSNMRQSTDFVEDGSYVRLRNVVLAYNIPFGNNSFLKYGRVYFNATNLLVLTNYSWYDPEVSEFGSGDLRLSVDGSVYPKARVFSLGINFGL